MYCRHDEVTLSLIPNSELYLIHRGKIFLTWKRTRPSSKYHKRSDRVKLIVLVVDWEQKSTNGPEPYRSCSTLILVHGDRMLNFQKVMITGSHERTANH